MTEKAGMWSWLLACPLLLLVGGIGWVDYITGPDYGLSLFYLAPVIVAGWWLGSGPVALVGITAACAWLMADLAVWPVPHLYASVWNAATRLVIYLVMGLLTARVRKDRELQTVLLKRERSLARTDPMTGLLNSRGFAERLEAEASRSGRSGEPLCVAYLDLDDFKKVNDVYGHGAGDDLVQRIGMVIRATIRRGDIPARLGGDEFGILFWRVDRKAAATVTRRLIDRIHAAGAAYPAARIGASIGIVWLERPPEVADRILTLADAAMYRAKLAGKNRVVFHSDAGGTVAAMKTGASS